MLNTTNRITIMLNTTNRITIMLNTTNLIVTYHHFDAANAACDEENVCSIVTLSS